MTHLSKMYSYACILVLRLLEFNILNSSKNWQKLRFLIHIFYWGKKTTEKMKVSHLVLFSYDTVVKFSGSNVYVMWIF